MNNSWLHHRRSKITAQISVAALALLLIVWLVAFRPYVRTDDARVAAQIVRIAPDSTTGRVVKLNVLEGSRVKAGDVLIELDHSYVDAALSRAKARAALANQTLMRIRQLSEKRGVPEREFDEALAAAKSADAELALAEIAVDRTYLKSPIDGIVVQKVTEEGNILSSGQTALSVADIDNAWISANIEETDVGRVKMGQQVDIAIDEGGNIEGKVLEVRHAAAAEFALIPAENPSGNFIKLVQRIPIKVEIDPHPDVALRVGQSVELKIHVTK